MSQLLSYSTRISEYCVLKSGVVYLQATLFHSKLKKCFFFNTVDFIIILRVGSDFMRVEFVSRK